MTSGFGRSDLIIIAGRPSMGKCLQEDTELVLKDGSISTIKEIYHRRQAELLTLKKNWKFGFTQPEAFVDEDKKQEIGVKTRMGRYIDSTKI